MTVGNDPPMPPPGPGDPADRLDPATAVRFIDSASHASGNAWSVLTARLRRDDGHGWFLVAARHWLGAAATEPGSLGLDRLNAIKADAKDAVQGATEPEALAAAWVGYALAVALAAAKHRTILSTIPVSQWLAVLTELSALAPAPWDDTFERALAVCLEAE